MSEGTIRLTNGSTAVVGTSTTFNSDLKSGDVISLTIGGVPYTLFVDTVTSNTAATLTDPFTGPTTSGVAYVAVPQMTLNRITAALAAQTAEAVRRVLQENANWQAFYSGAGDITVTLPDGSPAGRQVAGPSWAKLQSTIGNPLQLRGELPLDANLNNYRPAGENVGVWSKNTSVGATIANGFPEDGAVSLVEMFPANQFLGMQRVTVRGGKQYTRNLTGNWNDANPPWSEWYPASSMALASTLLSTTDNLNDLNTASKYKTYRAGSGTLANNYPYEGFAGSIEVVQGYGNGAQQFATSNYGNTFMRYLSSATVWTAWINTGMAALPGFFTGNADTLLDDGDYPTSSATTGLPDPALYGGTIPPNNCRLSVRSLRSNTSITQEWTYFGTAAAHIGRKFHREKYSTAAWSPWREVLDENSISLRYGLGTSSIPAMSGSFDWQQSDFVSGAILNLQWQQFTNPPTLTGPTPGATTRCFMTVDGVFTTSSVVRLLVFRGAIACDTYSILVTGAKGSRNIVVRRSWDEGATTVDTNGFIKKASPIVQIFGAGDAVVNAAASSAVVSREGVGLYRISGVLGLNADPAWSGIDGGFEIPHDRNKQPLLWVDFDVEASGDVVVKTYHRTHPLSPAFARNYVEGLADGDPCDIPAGRWLDVRVEMPEPEPIFEPEPEPEPEPVIEPEPDYYDEENQPDTQQ